VDTDTVRRKLFASCNAVLSNSVHQAEFVTLALAGLQCGGIMT